VGEHAAEVGVVDVVALVRLADLALTRPVGRSEHAGMAVTQLRLVRPLAADLHRPWERPLSAAKLTPARPRASPNRPHSAPPATPHPPAGPRQLSSTPILLRFASSSKGAIS